MRLPGNGSPVCGVDYSGGCAREIACAHLGGRRRQDLLRGSRALLCPLIRAEEEEALAANGPASGAAVLAALEGRHGSRNEIRSVELLVAHKPEKRSMEPISPQARGEFHQRPAP